jgi:hypothetical protein
MIIKNNIIMREKYKLQVASFNCKPYASGQPNQTTSGKPGHLFAAAQIKHGVTKLGEKFKMHDQRGGIYIGVHDNVIIKEYLSDGSIL